MTTKIFEEFPSRRNDRSASSSPERKGGSGPTDMKGRMEKKVRQAVYDIRYRARREGVDVKQAYSQYMQNSSLNGQERNLVKAKIFGRPMAEDYKIEEFASSSVAKALFKVFVEGVAVCPVLEGDAVADLNLMNGSCNAPAGKVWLNYSELDTLSISIRQLLESLLPVKSVWQLKSATGIHSYVSSGSVSINSCDFSSTYFDGLLATLLLNVILIIFGF